MQSMGYGKNQSALIPNNSQQTFTQEQIVMMNRRKAEQQ
jgi:hypothetical protein